MKKQRPVRLYDVFATNDRYDENFVVLAHTKADAKRFVRAELALSDEDGMKVEVITEVRVSHPSDLENMAEIMGFADEQLEKVGDVYCYDSGT